MAIVLERITTSDFNPLPSHEGRPDGCRIEPGAALISIRSPLTRGDYTHVGAAAAKTISIRSPLTRGDGGFTYLNPIYKISIRSPLTRGDTAQNIMKYNVSDFNPLPSYEGRRLRI